MQTLPLHELTGAELDQLQAFLASIKGAMSLEALDGFFCALISGPEPAMPNEYLPVVFGGGMPAFKSGEQARRITKMIAKHWNFVASTLQRERSYFPFLFEDETGRTTANEWAHGYMRGVQLRRNAWSRLVHDQKRSELITPFMALHFEHADDPKYRTGPFSDEKRESIVIQMIVNILEIYRYFRRQYFQDRRPPVNGQRRIAPSEESRDRLPGMRRNRFELADSLR